MTPTIITTIASAVTNLLTAATVCTALVLGAAVTRIAIAAVTAKEALER